MTATFRFAAAATLAAGLFVALPAAAQTAPKTQPSIAEMMARRANPAALSAAQQKQAATVAKQTEALAKLNAQKAEVQKRAADNQAALAQARKTR
jgi:hypothetical protein